MKSMFESGTFVNQFQLSEVPDRLINFATGAVATPDIEESLVDALNKGESLAETFVEERLVCKNGKPPSKSFHNPMKRASVKTMDALTKTVNIKSRNVSVPGEVMYLRLLTINNQKQVPLERVMGYENSAVPLSMFTNEGLMLSGNKSVFLHKLEGLIHDEVITDIPEADAIITDANAILHVLRVPDTKSSEVTHDDMPALFLRYLLASSRNTCGHGLSQIHISLISMTLTAQKGKHEENGQKDVQQSCITLHQRHRCQRIGSPFSVGKKTKLLWSSVTPITSKKKPRPT